MLIVRNVKHNTTVDAYILFTISKIKTLKFAYKKISNLKIPES